MTVETDAAARHPRLGLIAALARLSRLPAVDRGPTCEAALLLLLVRLALATLPLGAMLRLFRIHQGAAAAGRIDRHAADVIARAIARTSRHVPFRAVCLQQAFAALLMLRRRGLAATVHLGVLREGGELNAHAWSQCGDVPVTGVTAARGFTPVAVFAA